MKVVVTGGAGFIGSHLSQSLTREGVEVHVIDNFSTGQMPFLTEFNGAVHRVDLADESVDLRPILDGASVVYHLAANADVRFGWSDTRRDLQQNVLVTLRVAEAASAVGVDHFVFSSTGSVYGESATVPTPESAPFPVQTSLYGASKASAEGFLAAFAVNEAFEVTVFRFVSVLGPRYTHGHVIDFVRQLKRHPKELTVLGNGTQRKSYMHVDDCIRGVMSLRPTTRDKGFAVYNLGTNELCEVRDSLAWITNRMGVCPEVKYGSGDRGWVGDNPLILLDVSKAARQGWIPRYGIRESVECTVDWLVDNVWVLDLSDRHKVP